MSDLDGLFFNGSSKPFNSYRSSQTVFFEMVRIKLHKKRTAKPRTAKPRPARSPGVVGYMLAVVLLGAVPTCLFRYLGHFPFKEEVAKSEGGLDAVSSTPVKRRKPRRKRLPPPLVRDMRDVSFLALQPEGVLLPKQVALDTYWSAHGNSGRRLIETPEKEHLQLVSLQFFASMCS